MFIFTMVYQAARERNARIETAENGLANTAQLITSAARKEIETSRVLFVHVASSTDSLTHIDTEGCRGRFAQVVKWLPEYSNALFALPNGEVICGAALLNQPTNIGDLREFKSALASTDWIVGTARNSRVNGKLVLPIYRAVRDGNGEVRGVLRISLELSWLYDALTNSEFHEGARVGLMDAQGHVLARFPDPHHWVGKDVSETSFFKNAKARGGEGIMKDVGLDGVPRIYGLARFPGVTSPIILWVGYAAKTVTAGADQRFRAVLVGAAVVVLLTFMIIWFSAERLILRPVAILSGIARRLGSGDLRARSGIGVTRNELGALARSFDDMAEALESKNREIALAGRALKVLSAWSSVLVKPSDEQALAEGMCKAVAEVGGYQRAWVGFAEDNPGKTVRPVAFAGDTEEYFKTLQVTWADNERGQGPAARAIREGIPIVVSDIQTSPPGERWREHVRRFGYDSIMAVPLKTDERILGVLVICALEAGAFAQDEALLLGEVASNLASAIVAQRARAERERLMATLRSIEERFAAAAEASPDALFVFKSVRNALDTIVDFKITALNGRAAQQIGIAQDDAIGKTYLGLLPLYKTVSRFDEYAKVASTGERLEEEFTYEAPGKGTRWFRQQVIRVRDGIAISLRDITAWKTNGDRIREAEERLRLAMGAAHMAAFSTDLAGDTLTLSEEVGPIFGLPKGAGPRSTRALLEAVHPDDREAMASGIERSRQSAQAAHREFRVVWPDGTVHWVESYGNVICNEAGKPVRTVGVVADITQRKLAIRAVERANRALKTLSATNHALVHAAGESELLHRVCRVVVVDGGYLMAWVGFAQDDPQKTVRVAAYHGFEAGYLSTANISWADNERGQGPTGTAIRTGSAQISQNILTNPTMAPWREAALARGYQAAVSLPLNAEDRTFGALVMYAREPDAFDGEELALLKELAADLAFGIVTLRTRAERDRIKVSNIDLERFAYIASHDLRAPVRVIDGFARLLQESAAQRLDRDEADALARILQSTRHMGNMIEGLLEYARVDSKPRFFTEVDLHQACASALEMLQHSINDAGARIELGPLPTVLGDSAQLVELLQNLIGNALTYRSEAAPVIRVSTMRSGEEQVISIQDNGIGIDPAHHAEIFEMFKRLHAQHKIPGTGIGLATCQRIVERHGGRIWVESTLGAGSTFRFTLPVT